MQAALGELTYGSEAAERLRSELRGVTAHSAGLEARIAELEAAAAAAEQARDAAETAAAAAARGGESQVEEMRRLQVRTPVSSFNLLNFRVTLGLVSCPEDQGRVFVGNVSLDSSVFQRLAGRNGLDFLYFCVLMT